MRICSTSALPAHERFPFWADVVASTFVKLDCEAPQRDHFFGSVRHCTIGHSEIVGKPAAFLLMAEGATVTVCHHQTRSVAVRFLRAAVMNRSFIALVEAGVPSLKVPNHLSSGKTPSAP